jgi:hypothetical protein
LQNELADGPISRQKRPSSILNRIGAAGYPHARIIGRVEAGASSVAVQARPAARAG